MDLDLYLKRVGFSGEPRCDLETLTRLHRGHVENIPFENLDVQRGVPVSRDVGRIFEKLVVARRGGWCFEMNGLFAWALEQIGFDVVRMAGGVMRATLGDRMLGNHLALLVGLDRPHLADVGFGNGLIEPIAIKPGSVEQAGFTNGLEELGGGWWRFHADARSGAASYDFEARAGDEALLDAQCEWLQTDGESGFVLNAVVQKYAKGRHVALRGRVMRNVSSAGVATEELSSVEAYVATLEREFGLSVAGADALWRKIDARHRQLFPDSATA